MVQSFAPEYYPIIIELLHPITREVVWSYTATLADAQAEKPIHLPPVAKQCGHPVAVRVTFADGLIMEEPPPHEVMEAWLLTGRVP